MYTYNVWRNRGTLENAKRHGIDAHGYTEETFNERVGKDKENFRKSIKTSWFLYTIFFKLECLTDVNNYQFSVSSVIKNERI